ncbi:MAG: hypothetical protein KY469_10820 [Actinobacteria bacterium]|nr:hypothetical protein [Actinomycetota bacterium]
MPQFDVGTTAIQIVTGAYKRPTVRNLGPGNVGLGYTNQITVATAGIYLKPGEAYEWPTDLGWPDVGESSVWAIASAADTDVRVEQVG